MALYENVVWREGGCMANRQMTNYIMPTAADIPPPIRVFFRGASPIRSALHRRQRNRRVADGWAAACDHQCAIENAARNFRVAEIPATPEVLMEAMTEKAGALVSETVSRVRIAVQSQWSKRRHAAAFPMARLL